MKFRIVFWDVLVYIPEDNSENQSYFENSFNKRDVSEFTGDISVCQL
jgi:hypothetical protein